MTQELNVKIVTKAPPHKKNPQQKTKNKKNKQLTIDLESFCN